MVGFTGGFIGGFKGLFQGARFHTLCLASRFHARLHTGLFWRHMCEAQSCDKAQIVNVSPSARACLAVARVPYVSAPVQSKLSRYLLIACQLTLSKHPASQVALSL